MRSCYQTCVFAFGLAVSSLVGVLFVDCTAAEPRVPWTATTLRGSPDPPLEYRAERIFPGLEFDRPVTALQLPGRDRILVLEVGGDLLTFACDAAVTEAQRAGTVLDYVSNLNAALDVTLHPDFVDNGYIFVAWKCRPDLTPRGAKIVRLQLSDDPVPVVVPGSMKVIFEWTSGNHCGSALRFGPDGYLYASLGDGAGAFPPNEHRTAQNLSDIRGSVVRIDVDHATPDSAYSIPGDNPFVGVPNAREEIFALGVRNPWRMDFDPLTGELWAADVGWELWEMIHRIVPGGNYGWSVTEGPQPVHGDEPLGPGKLIPPQIALPHTESDSITGGIVIRGQSPRRLDGHYIYGDYVNGSVWSARVEGKRMVDHRRLAATGLAVISFASLNIDSKDQNRTLVILDHGGGLYRLVPNTVERDKAEFPRRLSRTGLFADMTALSPAPGVIAFQPTAGMWRDGATASRLIAVPGGEAVRTHKKRKLWGFQPWTVVANTISRRCVDTDGAIRDRKIETQILLYDGFLWQPYAYHWNDEQTDAELVPAVGLTVELTIPSERFGQIRYDHQIHSRAQCQSCHHSNVPGGISFTPHMLGGDVVQSQWRRLVEQAVVQQAVNVGKLVVDPADETQSLDDRARSYLAINCGHCHQRGGGGTAPIVLTRSTPQDKMNAIEAPVGQGSFGLVHGMEGLGQPSTISPGDGRVISAGSPFESVLYYRMGTIGSGHMPRIGAQLTDESGLKLVHDWIRGLSRADVSRETESPSATSAALRIQHEIFQLPFGEARDQAVEKLSGEYQPLTAGLFEAFVPPEQRVKKIGANADVAKLLTLSGVADRGRQWFAGSPASQCRSCHVAQGVGKRIGPDLDGIASKRSRSHLLESLLQPAAAIEPQWRTVSVLTDSGQQVTGVVVAEDAETLTLRDTKGVDVEIAKIEIELQKNQPQSVMPDGQVATMTEIELADLLAYLQSLR